MIIQSSAVQLEQYHRYDAQRSDKTVVAVGESINTAPGGLRALNLSVNFQQSEQFHYRNDSRQRFESASEVTDGDVQTVHQREYLTKQLVQVSLAGEAASIANQRVFPAGDGPNLSVSGEVTFEFAHQLTIQTQSYSAMSAGGQVTLADGRSINFNLFTSHTSMTSISAETKATMSAQVMSDPLVINFGTDSVALSDQYFEFDLNGDGDEQSLAQLGSGSGYLVLDLNGDGQVNDGSELFGTESGNGFTDLAKYDVDGNGWIDEADPIFKQLQLWTDQSNDAQLVSLASKDVGAIYLGNVEQSGDLRSSQGELLGQVKAAGMVLMEDGEVRTAQSIDLSDRVSDDELDVEATGLFSERQVEQFEAFAVAMNQMQQAQNSWQARLNQAGQSVFDTTESDKPDDAKNFFEQLFEYIRQAIAERKALLEKIESRYSDGT